MTDKHNSTPDSENVKLTPAQSLYLALARRSGEIRIFDRGALGQRTISRCAPLVKQGYLAASPDGRYFYLTAKAYDLIAREFPEQAVEL